MKTFVTGGSASGKSAFAEQLACESGSLRYYLAALDPYDVDAQRVIARHREMRAGKGFITIECSQGFNEIASQVEGGTCLVENLGNLVANTLFLRTGGVRDEDEVIWHILQGVVRLERACEHLVIVGNEVGSDGLRYSEDTKEYIRVLGKLSCALAAESDTVVLVEEGVPLLLKGERPSVRGYEICDLRDNPVKAVGFQ